MSISIALITNKINNVGVVGHDTSSGRVTHKFNSSAQICGDLLETFLERSILNELDEEVKGKGRFVMRVRVTPSEKEYINSLLSKAINPPFKVQYVEEIRQGSLSNLVTKEFEELI